jgi:hypothetical protein
VGNAVKLCPRCGWPNQVTVEEAAKEFGVVRQTVINWIKAGLLPNTVLEEVPGVRQYWISRRDLTRLRKTRERGAVRVTVGAA